MTKEVPLTEWVLGTKVIRAYLQELKQNIFRNDELKKFVLKHESDFNIYADDFGDPQLNPEFVKTFLDKMFGGEALKISKIVSRARGGYEFFIPTPKNVGIDDVRTRRYFIADKSFEWFTQKPELTEDINNLGIIIINRLKESFEYLPMKKDLMSRPKIKSVQVVGDGVEDKLIYEKGGLPPVRVADLLEKGYIEVNSYSIHSNKPTHYLIKPVGNETPEHNCAKLQVYQHLLEMGVKGLKVTATEAADVEFTDKDGRRVGVEVLRKTFVDSPEQLKVKAGNYSSKYDFWFVFGTNAIVCRQLRKLLPEIDVLERKDILFYLQKLV